MHSKLKNDSDSSSETTKLKTTTTNTTTSAKPSFVKKPSTNKTSETVIHGPSTITVLKLDDEEVNTTNSPKNINKTTATVTNTNAKQKSAEITTTTSKTTSANSSDGNKRDVTEVHHHHHHHYYPDGYWFNNTPKDGTIENFAERTAQFSEATAEKPNLIDVEVQASKMIKKDFSIRNNKQEIEGKTTRLNRTDKSKMEDGKNLTESSEWSLVSNTTTPPPILYHCPMPSEQGNKNKPISEQGLTCFQARLRFL